MELASAIKKHLLPSKSADPYVRISVPCDLTSFNLLKNKAIRRDKTTKEIYTLSKYADLEGTLGEKWFMRVVNPIGDFSYVILDTISFSIGI